MRFTNAFLVTLGFASSIMAAPAPMEADGPVYTLICNTPTMTTNCAAQGVTCARDGILEVTEHTPPACEEYCQCDRTFPLS
jgi:hypothetical protein